MHQDSITFYTRLGTDQASAAELDTVHNRIVAGASGDSVRLPEAGVSGERVVCNATGHKLKVFPPRGGQIGTLGTDAPLVLAPGKSAHLFCHGDGQWAVIVSA